MAVNWSTVGFFNNRIANMVERGSLPNTFLPLISSHMTYQVLQNLMRGGGSIYITYDEDDERKFAEMVAEEKCRELKQDIWVRFQYIAFDPPEYGVNICEGKCGWFIHVYLTNRGTAALNAISNNLVWNAVEHTIDFEATEKWYRFYLESKVLPDHIAEVIKNLPQPRFKSLHTDMIAFIMSSEHQRTEWRLV